MHSFCVRLSGTGMIMNIILLELNRKKQQLYLRKHSSQAIRRLYLGRSCAYSKYNKCKRLLNKPGLSSRLLFMFHMCHAYGLLMHGKENTVRSLRPGFFCKMHSLTIKTKSKQICRKHEAEMVWGGIIVNWRKRCLHEPKQTK